MADFTAADVKRLRDLTAAGIMDCKKALEEADGDFDQAVEILKVKGAKDVDKRANRVAGNGLVAVSGNAIVELACETDFVAKNVQFQDLAAAIARAVEAAHAADVPAALELTLDDGRTVGESVQALSAVIGEKLEVRRVAVLDGTVATYLHRKDPSLPPQIGVLVAYEGSDADAARSVAQQVAAMRPQYLSRDEVPAEVTEEVTRVEEAKTREEGKPEAAIAKIVEGRVNAYFKERVLLDQESILEAKRTVAQMLADKGLTVTGFARFEVGQA
jgi:elongation factor Ts